jgi:hypothetical protein
MLVQPYDDPFFPGWKDDDPSGPGKMLAGVILAAIAVFALVIFVISR